MFLMVVFNSVLSCGMNEFIYLSLYIKCLNKIETAWDFFSSVVIAFLSLQKNRTKKTILVFINGNKFKITWKKKNNMHEKHFDH